MRTQSNLSEFGQALQRTLPQVNKSSSAYQQVSTLSGAASALYLNLLSKQDSRLRLVITDTFETAEQIIQDLTLFSDPEGICFFPHWDTLPYDNQSPDKEAVATRFHTLSRLIENRCHTVVTTPNALMQKILPVSVFSDNCLTINVSEVYNRQDMVQKLVQMGFVRVDMVEEKGEFAVRGEIMDIFPISTNDPVRLDFFDDDLESLKYFDIESQRSGDSLKKVLLSPAKEVLYSDQDIQLALSQLIELKTNTLPVTYHSIKEAIENKMVFPGIESLLPLFYQSTCTVLDYFHEQPQIVFMDQDKIEERSKLYFDEIGNEYQYSLHEGNPTLSPDQLFLPPEILFGNLKQYQQLNLLKSNLDSGTPTQITTVDNAAIRSISMAPDKIGQSAIYNVLTQLKTWNSAESKIVIAVSSRSKADRLRQMLIELEIDVPIESEVNYTDRIDFFTQISSLNKGTFLIIPHQISSGFRWVNAVGETKFTLITGEEIFGPRQKKRRIKKSNIKHFFSSLGDLKTGDYVVHVEYGIGQYEGLKKISAGSSESDFLVITYQGGDKVYVPVDKFHLVQKYAGVDAGAPKVSKLGNKTWSKTKSKVRAEIDDMAEELGRIAAERKAKKGIAYSPESTSLNEFAMSFPFQETEDQEQAIADVMKDMGNTPPMDRLVCGDVGFGKTEVAMRAAYRAALDGYQVGILVPTTILAQQHYDSFKKRLENYAVNIGLLSRFQTPKNIKKTLKDLAEKQIDIVIGTHRLLSKDVKFSNLGLLVIDEEQRFGVKHKESIKQIKSTVDTLILSATPIPRTLHMSLVGIRDISVINTPPMDRRAIRTRLTKFSDYVIQEAVNREIRRKGQIFFIHNRVESIHQTGQYLNQILPRVRVGIAHGQMAERELETIMLDFINGEYDILLATTIVESGLDIPNVNTIIVNNSDRFGLSQLYQLRGRVGRSSVQAYAYLLTPREKVLSEIARKRLTILQELNHLGAGFKIASYDLELRGAGNVLGAQQSGHIIAVGFEMYTAMIEEAVSAITNADKTDKNKVDEIKLKLEAEVNLPDNYITSMNQRLDTYKSISACKSEDELWDVRSSLEDRFGVLPTTVVNLFDSIQIKLMAAEMDIVQIEQRTDQLDIKFTDLFQPDPIKITGFLADKAFKPKLLPDNRIQISLQNNKPENILRFLHTFRKKVC
ncbi:MAG: transcription-repair coupling factor [Deltaproteobacteria bacterium]|nr:transcription-repair coupling factor [Deltaproteobacteria bacterium]